MTIEGLGGRPLKFKTPEEMQKKIDAYFNKCDKTEEYYTITGLAMALKTTRQVLCDYEKRDEFTDTIKAGKLRVENDYELSLRKHGRAGEIFGLKNFGWTDKREVDSTITDKRVIIEMPDPDPDPDQTE